MMSFPALFCFLEPWIFWWNVATEITHEYYGVEVCDDLVRN